MALLEQTALPRILLFLMENKKASRTDLKQKIGASQDAIYHALEKLRANDLIIEHQPVGFQRRKDVSLTKKGQEIAELLRQLEKLL